MRKMEAEMIVIKKKKNNQYGKYEKYVDVQYEIMCFYLMKEFFIRKFLINFPLKKLEEKKNSEFFFFGRKIFSFSDSR